MSITLGVHAHGGFLQGRFYEHSIHTPGVMARHSENTHISCNTTSKQWDIAINKRVGNWQHLVPVKACRTRSRRILEFDWSTATQPNWLNSSCNVLQTLLRQAELLCVSNNSYHIVIITSGFHVLPPRNTCFAEPMRQI